MKYIKKFEKVEYADPMITLFEDFNDLDFFKNQNQDYAFSRNCRFGCRVCA